MGLQDGESMAVLTVAVVLVAAGVLVAVEEKAVVERASAPMEREVAVGTVGVAEVAKMVEVVKAVVAAAGLVLAMVAAQMADGELQLEVAMVEESLVEAEMASAVISEQVDWVRWMALEIVVVEEVAAPVDELEYRTATVAVVSAVAITVVLPLVLPAGMWAMERSILSIPHRSRMSYTCRTKDLNGHGTSLDKSAVQTAAAACLGTLLAVGVNGLDERVSLAATKPSCG